MRRAIIWTAVGFAIGAGICFVLGTATAARAYRGSTGDVTAAAVAVGTVLAIIGAMAGAFIGAVAAVIVFFRDGRRRPTPGPEEDYRELSDLPESGV